ncbi:MAG: thioredoxin domain-containing protein [Micrococcus sp.]|nr:thioredoxin domain-containing protein [Micrococcus sp.]
MTCARRTVDAITEEKYVATNNSKQTKAQRVSDSRARARAMQEQQRKREARRRTTIIWGSVVAVVAIIALVVGFVMMNTNRSIPTAGPSSDVANAEGGVVLTSATQLQEQPADALPDEVDAESVPEPDGTAGSQPETVPGAAASSGEPAHVIVYADFNCVHCANFEDQYAGQMKQWLDEGKITLEYRMLGFLDSPANSNYSSRAANAALCVADANPGAYNDFVTGVFSTFAEREGRGLSDDELVARAQDLDADIASCQNNNTYRPMVQYTTAKARAAGVGGTPTVFVNDQLLAETEFSALVEEQVQD